MTALNVKKYFFARGGSETKFSKGHYRQRGPEQPKLREAQPYDE